MGLKKKIRIKIVLKFQWGNNEFDGSGSKNKMPLDNETNINYFSFMGLFIFFDVNEMVVLCVIAF